MFLYVSVCEWEYTYMYACARVYGKAFLIIRKLIAKTDSPRVTGEEWSAFCLSVAPVSFVTGLCAAVQERLILSSPTPTDL